MNKKKLENKFLNIIKKNLLIKKKIELDDKVVNFKNWDSLNNVRIFIDLNKEFKKDLKLGSIKNIKILRDLFNYFL
tara:strand:- start:327 stop:554 length:228 start_codon:yes stop_codon:yes gene_type:complete